MFRRSLFLFAIFVLTGLGLTTLYAVFRLRGPEDVLAEARAKLDKGDNVAAVRLLDQCEPGSGMRDNAALRRELWRLRLLAHRRLDNDRRALRDVENLLRDGDGSEELQLQRIFYLARLDEGAQARQRALEFVAANRRSARGLELAGEACQVEYRDDLVQMAGRIRSDLDSLHEQQGLDALLEFLYRPAGDPGVLVALETLRAFYDREPRFQQVWPSLQESLRGLRERIQQALGFWQRSLELAKPGSGQGNLMIAAFRGVALSMEQARRHDDLVAQAEIYLSSFDHRFASEAAAAAARAHLRDGLPAAAVEVADRFLPPGSHRARIAGQKLDKGVEELLVTKAFALHQLGRAAELERLGAELRDMMAPQQNAPGLELPLASAVTGALLALLQDNARNAEANLAVATGLLLRKPAPATGADPLEQLMTSRLDLLRARKAKPGPTLDVIGAWARARPNSLAPLRERARVQLENGQAQASMATTKDILTMQPVDEQALRALASAADIVYRGSGQDGEALLQQCLQRTKLRPEPPHPIGYLLCCEAALRQGEAAIALESARAAVDQFPWARWPRHLEARAELAAGHKAAAIEVLDQAIEADPDDREALAMWFDVSRRAGQAVQEHLAAVARTGVESAAAAIELLRAALAENSPSAVALARAAAARADASAELLALAALAIARTGDAATARPLLERAAKALGDKTEPATTEALGLATIGWLQALARTTVDTELAALARDHLQRLRLAGLESASCLLAAAAALERTGHRQTAHLFATTALALGDAGESRDAAGFLLAGRLALQLGRRAEAAVHFTAALSFPDGAAAAEPLARLELQARPDRAREAFALAAEPTDPALALLCGSPEAALRLAQQRVRADPGDLLPQLLFALLGEVAADAIGADLRELDEPARNDVVESIALLAEPALAAATLPRVQELAAARPDSLACRLLLARALVDAGRAAEASAIHAACFAAGCRDLLLFTEAVRAATPTDPMPAPILEELQSRAKSEPEGLTPSLIAFAIRTFAAQAAIAGQPDAAARILADLWLRSPDASGVKVEDALGLLRQGRAQDAIVLLDHLRRTRTGDERHAAATALFVAAIDHAPALGPTFATTLQRGALEELAGGASGAAFAFLIADPRRLAEVSDADQRAWLETLLHACATGRENWSFGRAALAHLERREGAAAALQVVDRLAAAHPAGLQLWVERARLMAGQRRGVEGLQDARNVLALADDPPLVLDFLVLAAEERLLVAADLDRLRQLPPPLLDAPPGRYLAGLAALRQGRAGEAEPLLASAPPRPSGFHLYARALANLMRRDPAARATAARLFDTLAVDYANSSLARYAGSFARQLAPN